MTLLEQRQAGTGAHCHVPILALGLHCCPSPGPALLVQRPCPNALDCLPQLGMRYAQLIHSLSVRSVAP